MAGGEELGETQGYARANGRYTDPHNQLKRIFVKTLAPAGRSPARVRRPRMRRRRLGHELE